MNCNNRSGRKMGFVFFAAAIVLAACSTKLRKNASAPGSSIVSPQPDAQLQPSGENDFQAFLERFNRDSLFQLESVRFPLIWLNENDLPYGSVQYDTVLLSREDYEPELLKDTVGNFIPGLQTNVTVNGTGKERTVLLQVEDSGIHVVYFFRFRKKWELYRVEDAST